MIINNVVNKVFIGFDSREVVAYNACTRSMLANSSIDIDIIPLKLNTLTELGIYRRDIDPLSSTEFPFSRFLIPYLCNYKGWALFCDCDFIFLEDVKTLLELKDDKYAVMCVQHDYTPSAKIKMDNQVQHLYPRKNWSSLVLWNCAHPSNKKLTPDIVNTQTGQYLHRFTWLKDSEIGSLPFNWNWLVGWYKEPKDGKPKAVHFTEGGPWFENYKDCEYSEYYYRYA